MKKPLRIAVASGKGGTGKTTIATNLAVVLAETEASVAYVDCDVEEPNGHIFLKPTITQTLEVSIPVPSIDEARCTLCGACGNACRYSAIVALPTKLLTFPKLCHGCGGCSLACSVGAIREVPRVTGVVETGVSGRLGFLRGRLDIGEAMAPPVIRAVLAAAPENSTLVLDAPPGTSCPTIESVKTADVVLLVTEPTPFGLHDLKLAVAMLRELGLPFGVVINRTGIGDGAALDYCATERIPVLLEVANDRAVAHAYSRGELAIHALPQLKPHFLALAAKLAELALVAKPEPAKREPVPALEAALEAQAANTVPAQSMRLGPKSVFRELVVVSGKGGTGKTSIVASFFALAERAAVADCDVDAADLHLVLAPTVLERRPFFGGSTALVDGKRCTGCGICAARCRFDAIRTPVTVDTVAYDVDPMSCEGCGVCVDVCPEHAVTLAPTTNGEWFVSETRHGPMVHARLGIAQENSGKLVSLVRRKAQVVARSNRCNLLICDGSPGIGCPVIASIAGASMVLVVTEPTLSGLHDLRRVLDLCRQLHVKASVCVNKADINLEVTATIEAEASRMGIRTLGRVRYDDTVTQAQVKGIAVVECGRCPADADFRSLWKEVRSAIPGAH
jgi:MinD superfamily P-loop ATPase